MVICQKCNTKNDDDSTFCTKCGNYLKSDTTSNIEQHVKKFAKNIEQMGQRFGEQMTNNAKQIHHESYKNAKHFEHKIDRVSRHIENQYNQIFGIFAPLLESFIFLIVIRLVIAMMQIPSVKTPEMNILAEIFFAYILPLFAITLISNYTKYLSKKSYQFRIFSPLFYALSMLLFLWIVVKILNEISFRLKITDVGTAATSLENNLPTIFVFALLAGYVILALTMPKNPEKKS